MGRLLLPNDSRDPEKFISKLKDTEESVWEEKSRRKVLELFYRTAKKVPAYKKFLLKNKVNFSKIQTIKDFRNLPTTDKDSYLRKFSLSELCWNGKFSEKHFTICTTSGSTGEPFYFPHRIDQDWQYAVLVETYLRTNFEIHKKKTLYVNGFPMGAWIGGTFTFKAISLIAEKSNYALSIISPGVNKQEVIRAVEKLGPYFDQVIIGSYGPFLKDILDEGVKQGINWGKYNLGFIFSAEGFTEEFRDYVCRVGSVKDSLRRTLNHYGTVDLGTMSYETPISILARRLAINNKNLYKSLFGESVVLPTLTQYMPNMFYFEEVNGNLLCSAFSGLPLVRYDLKDRGGIYKFSELVKKFSECEIDLIKESKKAKIEDTIWKLPFVYVYERSDFSISFYAFQIYPATIRKALQKREFSKHITGKFTIMTKYDNRQNQYVEINVELMKDINPSDGLKEKIKKAATEQLIKDSSEYRETHKEKGGRVDPKVVFWTYEHPTYFKSGIKQKWVKK